MKALSSILLATTFLSLGSLIAGCDSTQSATRKSAALAENKKATVDAPPLDRSQRPPAGPLPQSTFPEYETVVLDNGLTLYLIESDRQPTITYRLMLRSGGLYDGDKPGLAELATDMLAKGVEGKSAFEIASETDFIGGSIATESTSDFSAVTVSGLSKYSDQLLGTLSELVLEPTFPEEELAKMKQRYISGIQSERQNPGAMADLLRRKLVYGDNGYGLFKTEESVESVTRHDLELFHETHFAPNNASLAIVGDFERKEMLKSVKQALADWSSRPLEPLPPLEFPEIAGPSVHIIDRPDSVQSAIRVAQQTVGRSDPDVTELRVLMSILGGGNSGRMYRNLREDKGYTYGAFTYAANAAHSGAIVTSVEVRNDVTEDAIRQILLELKGIDGGEIAPDELDLHKKYLTGNYIMSLESPDVTASRVQEIDIYGLEPDFYRSYVMRLSDLTKAVAEKLAERLIKSDDLVIAIVGDASKIAPSLEQFGPVTIYDDRLQVKSAPSDP